MIFLREGGFIEVDSNCCVTNMGPWRSWLRKCYITKRVPQKPWLKKRYVTNRGPTWPIRCFRFFPINIAIITCISSHMNQLSTRTRTCGINLTNSDLKGGSGSLSSQSRDAKSDYRACAIFPRAVLIFWLSVTTCKICFASTAALIFNLGTAMLTFGRYKHKISTISVQLLYV